MWPCRVEAQSRDHDGRLYLDFEVLPGDKEEFPLLHEKRRVLGAESVSGSQEGRGLLCVLQCSSLYADGGPCLRLSGR